MFVKAVFVKDTNQPSPPRRRTVFLFVAGNGGNGGSEAVLFLLPPLLHSHTRTNVGWPSYHQPTVSIPSGAAADLLQHAEVLQSPYMLVSAQLNVSDEHRESPWAKWPSVQLHIALEEADPWMYRLLSLTAHHTSVPMLYNVPLYTSSSTLRGISNVRTALNRLKVCTCRARRRGGRVGQKGGFRRRMRQSSVYAPPAPRKGWQSCACFVLRVMLVTAGGLHKLADGTDGL